MRRPLRWFVAALVLARAVRPHREERRPRERIIPAELQQRLAKTQ